ncbi:CYTH domain-containing protein [Enterococcus italicus]|uniref:CYTH domain-containing protein n=1 Tax=Enterococcus italicus TaxID=246144 RepID=UPI0020737561|nr:CYTH domain-containing protein [Enterococcus italicus]
MSEQLEIEWKTALTKEEYTRLLTKLNITEFFIQTNSYFDTPTFTLQSKKCGLRIRLLDTYAELTLKSPQPVGKLETTDQLTLAEAKELLQLGRIPNEGAVAQALETLGIHPAEVIKFAELTTKRAELPINEGLLAIDENWAHNLHDYELELEVDEAHADQAHFLNLLNDWNLTFRPTKNKIQRAKEAADSTK